MFKQNIFKILEIFSRKFLTIDEVKNFMRIVDNFDDQLIATLIEAAISSAESFTKLSIIQRRIEFQSAINYSREFALKYFPINKIVRINIISGDKKLLVNEDKYSIINSASSLSLEYIGSHSEKLIVEYICGFDQKDLPKSIKQGMLIHVAEMYDRERCDSVSLSNEIKSLYLPYRHMKL